MDDSEENVLPDGSSEVEEAEPSDMDSDERQTDLNNVDTPTTEQGLNGHDGEASQDSISSDPEQSPEVIVLDSGSDDEVYTNPEPPAELLSGELINAGNIGDTVYSKHWLFTTLMNLIKVVDKEENAKEEADSSDLGVDLEESLQDELCKLWDMSMNPAVVSLLMDFKCIDILTGVVAKSKAPRATEICVGILGNMACTETACKAISVNDKLRTLILSLLESPDAPTLVETTRLLYTCMSSASVYDLWMTSVRDTPSVFNSLVFILESSRNTDLLSHTADLIDKVMDTEDDLLIQWSQPSLVRGILEAIKQCRTNRETLDTFLHILQLITTCDGGVEAIGSHSQAMCELALQYILQLCDDDVLVLEGGGNSLGCVLCVLTTAFTSLGDKAKLVVMDFQLMRCLLKILDDIYQKVRQFVPQSRRQSSRSDSCSEKPRSRNNSMCEQSSETGQGPCSRNPSREESEKEQDDSNVSKDEIASCDAAECSKKNQGSDKEGINLRKNSTDSATNEMLYEVLQNLLTDVILVLTEQSENSPEEDSRTNTSNQSECAKQSPERHSKTLTYLNDHCQRQRLQILVYTLDEVLQDTEMDCCSRLKQTAHKYKFERLERIIEEYSAG